MAFEGARRRFQRCLDGAWVYTYVETLRKQAAPAARAQSFTEVVGFAKGTIGFNYDVEEERKTNHAGLVAAKKGEIVTLAAPIGPN